MACSRPGATGHTARVAYSGSDFYCDVALPRLEELHVVELTEHAVAIHHTRPSWPVHIVIFPRRHLASLTTLTADDEAVVRDVLALVQRVAARVEREEGAARVLTNLGDYQDSKHLHVHVTSGPERPPAA